MWDMWQGLYPHMMLGIIPFMSFDKYRQELYKPQPRVTQKTSAEIEQEMLAVVAAYEGR